MGENFYGKLHAHDLVLVGLKWENLPLQTLRIPELTFLLYILLLVTLHTLVVSRSRGFRCFSPKEFLSSRQRDINRSHLWPFQLYSLSLSSQLYSPFLRKDCGRFPYFTSLIL